MENFKYTFETSPSKKGICPSCGAQNSFRYYTELAREYGRCELINNCGYHNKPSGVVNDAIRTSIEIVAKPIYPSRDHCEKIVATQESTFHQFCTKNLGINSEHLKRWNVGRHKGKTAFVYQNQQNEFLNIVSIEYEVNGKRNKSKTPYSLRSKSKTEKYSLCLFGEHLLSDDSVICLVESEKTACIASFFYPQFDWLATGGSNKLTREKINVLDGRKVYYLNDADKAGIENSSLKRLEQFHTDFSIVNLFPDRTDGYDLADAIIDGQRPEIIPKSNTTAVKIIEKKEVSSFEKVEKYLASLYDLRYNQISGEVEYKSKEDSEYKDINLNNVFRLLQHNMIKFSMPNLNALFGSDFVERYNPFEEYFEKLPKWKGNDIDYIDKLASYVEAKDPVRFRLHFKKMLVRSIACALNNGEFNKQAFILVHDKQNSGKSTFCRWLCPTELQKYYTENISTDKDGLISLCENFIINLDELATLTKMELNSLKSVFSKDIVKIRKPYDSKQKVYHRRANFIGSTNKTEFLNDETGSVRWLCFEIISINWNYQIEIDINQVWSQAYSLFKTGFNYKLTGDELKENELINKEHQIATPEIELIQQYFSPGTKQDHDQFYTATDIQRVLSEKCENRIRLNSNNIGKGLKYLGFERSQQHRDPHPVKGYYVKIIQRDQTTTTLL